MTTTRSPPRGFGAGTGCAAAICHPRESLRSYRAALDCCDRGGGTDPLILTESLAGMAWAQAVAGDAGRGG